MTARDARQQIGDHHKAVILTCQSYHMSPMIHPVHATHASWHSIPSNPMHCLSSSSFRRSECETDWDTLSLLTKDSDALRRVGAITMVPGQG